MPVAAKGGFSAWGWRVLGCSDYVLFLVALIMFCFCCSDYVLVVCELQFRHALQDLKEVEQASFFFS